MARYVVKTESKRMGTHFSFEVSVGREDLPRAERALSLADALVKNIEAELSEYRETSAVSRLNRAPVGEVHELSPVFHAILKASVRLVEQTGSAFDPSFRSGAGTHFFDRFEVDLVRRTITRKIPEAHLAFGAIGKGFALDEVKKLLDEEGFLNFRLNAGGSSIILSGTLDEGTPWPLSWAWKKDSDGSLRGRDLRLQTGDPICIGVSGSLEKGEHIVRQTSGKESELRSAWVACESAADADALSTALFALGWEEGFPRIMDPLKRIAVGAIDSSEVPYWNGFFQKTFGQLEEGKSA